MDLKQKAVAALRLITKPEQIRAVLLRPMRIGTVGRVLLEGVLTPEHINIVYEAIIDAQANVLVAHLTDDELTTLIMIHNNPALQHYISLGEEIVRANETVTKELGSLVAQWISDAAKEAALSRRPATNQPEDTNAGKADA